MDKQIEMVATCHTAFGTPGRRTPGVPTFSMQGKSQIMRAASALATLAADLKLKAAAANKLGQKDLGLALVRLQLMVEENGEFAKALADGDLESMLHELADVRVVTSGTVLVYGLQNVIEGADELVYRANMAKLGPDGTPIIHESGRWMKPEGWQPADLGPLLAEAAAK